MNRLQEFLDNPHIITGTATVAADPQLTLIAANKALYTLVGETAESCRQQGNSLLPWIEQSSAVRLIHKPTGIVVASQQERSQFQNKDNCMKMLRAKLVELKQQQHAEKISDIKGVQMKIEWGSQIRSYVFMPYQMVKDTRTGYETGNIDNVMDGDLDGFINAYLTQLATGELKK